MKVITLLLSILIVSKATNAAQTCEDYITNEWPDSRYIIEAISSDNVVTDNKTGLMWKQCSEGQSGADCSTGTSTSHTWQQALDLANTSDYAGLSNWRVPNQKELRSIVARNCYSPSINETVFPNTPLQWFWSSSPIADFASHAWVVLFDFGYDIIEERDFNDRVRLVRTTQ